MQTKLNFKQIITAGLLAGGVSAILNAILFYTFHSANVLVDSIQIQPNTPLTIVPIIISRPLQGNNYINNLIVNNLIIFSSVFL